MRILVIHDKGLQGGGTRMQIDRVLEALGSADLSVLQLRLGLPDVGEDGDTFPSTFWPYQAMAYRNALLRKVSIFDPHVIHLHGSAGSLSAVLFKSLAARWPLVVSLHDVGLFCMSGLRVTNGTQENECTQLAGARCWTSGCWQPESRGKSIAAIALLAAKRTQRREWLRARRILVPSSYMARLARQHGADEAAVGVLPNICPPSAVPPLRPEAPPHILYVGRLTREKGADLALEALARLPSAGWSATFAGDGPERTALEARARQLGLSGVTFVGWLRQPELESLRARSTLSVLPSRVIESSGLSGVESLAAGRPVVAVARGGVTDWLIDRSTGFGVRAADPSLFAEAIMTLISDRALARKLGEQGRRLVAERFSPEAHRKLVLNIYADVANCQPEAVP